MQGGEAAEKLSLRVRFKADTVDSFIERYAVDVSPGGIFLRTRDLFSVGTCLAFRFELSDGTALLAGEGKIVWSRAYSPKRPQIIAGMGLRFDELTEASQQVHRQILRAKKQIESPQRDGAGEREAESAEVLQ